MVCTNWLLLLSWRCLTGCCCWQYLTCREQSRTPVETCGCSRRLPCICGLAMIVSTTQKSCLNGAHHTAGPPYSTRTHSHRHCHYVPLTVCVFHYTHSLHHTQHNTDTHRTTDPHSHHPQVAIAQPYTKYNCKTPQSESQLGRSSHNDRLLCTAACLFTTCSSSATTRSQSAGHLQLSSWLHFASSRPLRHVLGKSFLKTRCVMQCVVQRVVVM